MDSLSHVSLTQQNLGFLFLHEGDVRRQVPEAGGEGRAAVRRCWIVGAVVAEEGGRQDHADEQAARVQQLPFAHNSSLNLKSLSQS